MFAPDENNNNGFLDNINKLAGTGLNIVSLINGIKGIGTDNPYFYPQQNFNMNIPQGQFPQGQASLPQMPQQFSSGQSQQFSPLFSRNQNFIGGGFM